MNHSPIETLRRNLPQEADAALIISPVNRRYYTGMPSSDGALLITRNDAVLLIDFRYIEKARQTAKGCEVILRERLFEQLHALLAARNVKTLAVETDRMTVRQFSNFQKELPTYTLLDSPDLDHAITEQRAIKSAQELTLMRAAQQVTDRSFSELLNFIKADVTERQVANELLRIMRDFGGEGEAFDTIAVSGKNSSMPHGVPSDKPLEAGDFFTLDFGAMKDGYCSDMTRTVAIGHTTEEMERVYHTVLAAQQAAFSAIRADVPCCDIDAVARQVIEEDAGYRGCFGHSLGHSLGLEVHETPNFASHCQKLTRAGNVLSVEPGIYLEGKFGVRIEDVVCITETGFEDLTHSTKELLCL